MMNRHLSHFCERMNYLISSRRTKSDFKMFYCLGKSEWNSPLVIILFSGCRSTNQAFLSNLNIFQFSNIFVKLKIFHSSWWWEYDELFLLINFNFLRVCPQAVIIFNQIETENDAETARQTLFYKIFKKFSFTENLNCDFYAPLFDLGIS